MKAAAPIVALQPLAMLPFIYVYSHFFRNELSAVLTLFVYMCIIQYFLPYLTMLIRVSAPMEVWGDILFQYNKMLPMYNSASAMLFNSSILKIMARFRE